MLDQMLDSAKTLVFMAQRLLLFLPCIFVNLPEILSCSVRRKPFLPPDLRGDFSDTAADHLALHRAEGQSHVGVMALCGIGLAV